MTRSKGSEFNQSSDERSAKAADEKQETGTSNNSERLVEALRRSLLENEQLKRSNRKLISAAREPIAVIAMGCRLPGGVRTPEQLWQLLIDEKNVIQRFPTDRGWDLGPLLNQNSGDGQSSDGQWGGFLDDVAGFDAGFFGISDREALAMDPQQRLLLETAWEVIERAGIVPSSLKNSPTGVFVGVLHTAYIPSIEQPAPSVDGYRLQGGITNMASGRISFTLGLSGPAITVDTACSAGSTALHLAVRSLRTNECSLAIAGGAMVMATPEVFVEFIRQGGLAPDGLCKAFGEGADGTVFSEGVGLLLLERLSDAVQAGHPVLGVIRGSAANQDGASNGLTAPNGPAQEQVIRLALADAGLQFSDVDAVEAHGTGTALGDPIEANALINTYGKKRPNDEPLWLGSLKSNIGHTQTAAGVIGVIKMIMAIQHGELPKTLHANKPSSKIDWSAGAVRLLNDKRAWPNTGRPRRAAVSAFGFSGTNTHIILEQAPAADKTPDEQVQLPETSAPGLSFQGYVWPLSAASSGGLQAKATQLAEMVRSSQDIDLAAIGFSLATTRAHLDHRAVLIAADRDSLLANLDALSKNQHPPEVAQGVRTSSGRTAFLFSGQGSQWPTMGKVLYARSPVFAEALNDVCKHLDPHLPHPLQTIMFADQDTDEARLLERTDFTQPALFAFEVAMYRTVRHFGAIPDFIAGHSIGEIAAAHVAGVLSLADAALFVATRGRLMQSISAAGAMIVIETSESEILKTLRGYEDRVSIAAINAPTSVVISGDDETVSRIAAQCQDKGHRTHRLRVSHGFHSPHIDAIVDELRKTVAGLTFRPCAIPIVSTVTGTLLSDEQVRSPEYWAGQARKAVRFADAVEWLKSNRVTTFLEIGPDAPLTALGRLNSESPQPDSADIAWIATAQKNRDELRVFIAALTRLYARGHRLDWTRLLAHAGTVALPTYPFQHRQYWLHRTTEAPPEGGGLIRLTHPFMNTKIEIAEEQSWVFTGTLSDRKHAWLADHKVNGEAKVPGVLIAELMLAAGKLLGCNYLETLYLHIPMPLPENTTIDIQLRIHAAADDGRRPTELYFRLPGEGIDTVDVEQKWIRHASGALALTECAVPAWPDMQVWPPSNAEPVSLDGLYEALALHGVTFGPAFHLVTAAWRSDNGLFVEAALPPLDAEAEKGFAIHPTLLDAGMQAALLEPAGTSGSEHRILFSINGVRIYAERATALRAHVSTKTAVSVDPGHSEHSLRLVDQAGKPVAEIDSFVLRSINPKSITRTHGRNLRPYRVAWREHPLEANPAPRNVCWIVPEPRPTWLPSDLKPAFPDVMHGIEAMAAKLGRVDAAVLVCADSPDNVVAEAYDITCRTLISIQTWLASERTEGCPLVVLTRGAVAAGETDDVPNLSQSPVWGLLRTAQREHPGRFILIDIDEDATPAQLQSALSSALSGHPSSREPQIALRRGRAYVPRLTKKACDMTLTPPAGNSPWRLTVPENAEDDIDDLVFAPCPESEAALSDGEVRVAVRAVALHSRETLLGMGMSSERGQFGNEFAGVVVEVGPGVEKLHPGDRVMGIVRQGAMRSLAITEARCLTHIPRGWTFAEAATVPGAFGAAWQSRIEEGFNEGSLRPLPLSAMDIRFAPRAIQLMRDTGHTDRIVLTVSRPLDPDGTVLITGGTGALGAILARHLAKEGLTRHLLLTSRRGADADGAHALRAELDELGVQTTIAACDIADFEALKALLDSVPEAHPLTAVIHAAGTVDTADLQALTPGHIQTVMQAKVNAGWHLHRLTQHLDLAAFVFYSSAVGIIGMPGQANYAAANSFLDALGCHRRRLGLPATVLAWGMWDARSEMGKKLGDEMIQQVIGSGCPPMPAKEGLAYLDNAIGIGPDSHLPLLVPARLDLEILRSRGLTALLSEFAASTRSSSSATGVDAAGQLRNLPAAERHQFLLAMITTHAGAVLRHPDPSSIRVDSEFRSLGFDSLTSVEMSSRLAAATGLRIPATAVFDHPTAANLATYLGDQLDQAGGPVSPAPFRTEQCDSEGRFMGLLRGAISRGQAREGVDVLAAAARLRPSFSSPAKPENIPSATWLHHEGRRPILICPDSFIHARANLTYQRLSTALNSKYDLAAVPLPGYRNGEALPSCVEVVEEALASAIETCAEGRPFILAGFSTGGSVAHASTRCLEARGIFPQAVVLIDSFPPSSMETIALSDVLAEWSNSKGGFWSYDDDALTAMAWYINLFGPRWKPKKLKAPLLLVQAGDQLPSDPSKSWAQEWPGLTECVTTPGSHFGLLTEYVTQTAQTINGLLDKLKATSA